MSNVFEQDRVEEAFTDGLQTCREYMARFVENSGDATTAASIRANWNPRWGRDPGQPSGPIPFNAWGDVDEVEELYAKNRRIALDHVALASARARIASHDCAQGIVEI